MNSAFVDPAVEPTGARIAAALGPAAGTWNELVSQCSSKGVEVAWRHYRDGGWLARASRGGKTVAWLSVAPELVKVTFYFAERHRGQLGEATGLSVGLRDRVAAVDLIGRLLPVSLELHGGSDLGDFGHILDFKLSAR